MTRIKKNKNGIGSKVKVFFKKVWGGIKTAGKWVGQHIVKPVYTHVVKPVIGGVKRIIGAAGPTVGTAIGAAAGAAAGSPQAGAAIGGALGTIGQMLVNT